MTAESLAAEVRRESRRLGGDGVVTLFGGRYDDSWTAWTTTRRRRMPNRTASRSGRTIEDALRALLRHLATLPVDAR